MHAQTTMQIGHNAGVKCTCGWVGMPWEAAGRWERQSQGCQQQQLYPVGMQAQVHASSGIGAGLDPGRRLAPRCLTLTACTCTSRVRKEERRGKGAFTHVHRGCQTQLQLNSSCVAIRGWGRNAGRDNERGTQNPGKDPGGCRPCQGAPQWWPPHDVNVVNVHVMQGKGMNTTVMNEVPTT